LFCAPRQALSRGAHIAVGAVREKMETEFHYGGGAAECGRQELDQTSDRMNGERRRRCFDGWLSAIELSM